MGCVMERRILFTSPPPPPLIDRVPDNLVTVYTHFVVVVVVSVSIGLRRVQILGQIFRCWQFFKAEM